MRVIICGGRKFWERARMYQELDRIDSEKRILTVITGGANGADFLAQSWAEARLKHLVVFEAQWDKYGKSAGPIRNEQMLKESGPDLVIAFPGGRGTAHMIAISRRDGVPVLEVK